jgi:hypothetical protein
MRFILSQIVMIAVMALSSSAFAEIYVWEDETGAHAASDPKDVPPEVLKRYDDKSPSSEKVNTPKRSETITTDTNNIDKDNIVFRGMRWGSKLSEYKDMVLIESGSSQYYNKKNEQRSIGGATLNKIAYGFFDNRLFSVIIEFVGDSNFYQLHETLNQNYGYGFQSNQFMDNYWYCLRCESTVYLEYSKIGRKGTISYRYKPISEEVTNFDKEQAKRAEKDL